MALTAANPRALVKGLLSYVASDFTHIRHAPRSAVYFHSALLRHLIRLDALGHRPSMGTVAELGPGAALGMGITALLLGAERYVGLDVSPYAASDDYNAQMVDEITTLVRRREGPGFGEGMKNLKPALNTYDFPAEMFSNTDFSALLSADRLQRIKAAVRQPDNKGLNKATVAYMAPWQDRQVITPATLDWLFSQAVLEHVDGLEEAYHDMFRWLKPGGVMSHQVDFKSHGTSAHWNGHWAIGPCTWRLIRGKRPYLLNRLPMSAHIRAVENAGFEIVAAQPVAPPSAGLPRARLAAPWRSLDDSDLQASGMFLVARRPD